jgi:PAS domain S-box-containing protein
MKAPESSSPGTATRPDTQREARRLRTLEQYDVLDAPPVEAFDRITRLATRLFDVQVALINFIDQEDQWCLSSCGISLNRTSLEVSFCVHTIHQKGVMVVEDAQEDDRFDDNPLVTGSPHIRFYAGAPLTASNGARLGALCLLDDEPRAFSTNDQEMLADLAGVVMDELNLRHYASDLDDSRKAHRELSEQRRRILESITDAFVALDDDWTLTYVNAQAEALLDRSREELRGKNLWDEFPDAIGSTFQDRYETALEEQTTVEFVEHYPPLDRWFEVKAFPFEGGLSVYFDDVTERMEARENLRREEDLTKAIMDTSVAAVVIIEADRVVSLANDRAENILGTGDEEGLDGEVYAGTLRTPDGTLVPEGEWPFDRILETGTPISDERYLYQRTDGGERYIAINGAPLFNADGTIRQVVFSIDDITDQVRYERKLKAAKEEAEQANQLKSAFLANMSHDVQTPLSSIMNHADLLRMEVGDQHQDRIDLIKRSSNRLLNTLESVLDLSKLEAGAVETAPEKIDLADELLGTVEIFQPQATDNDITLGAEVEEPLPVELDPTMLHRVIDNLLSNALKFTEAGGAVTLRAQHKDDMIVIDVEDTGVGIDESFLPNLFEPFARGADSSKIQGTGLGLAITKRLTDMMGGDIDVESEKGNGTTFTVRLPGPSA